MAGSVKLLQSCNITADEHRMDGRELKKYRRDRGLTQEQAARRLGVSQTYLSLFENNKRRMPEGLTHKLVKKLHLSPAELPANATMHRVSKVSDDQLTGDLAALGYKGFSHKKPTRPKNPADVLLSALRSDKRDARLMEALPWVVLKFPDMEWQKLVETSRVYNLQNRLGFVIDLAKQVAESKNDRETASKLARWRSELELSKLEREDTLCNDSMTQTERNWLKTKRTNAARNWNLLTDLSPEDLRYAS